MWLATLGLLMKKYRPNVGMVVLNAQGDIFCGQRIYKPSLDPHFLWQMPQGGIQAGEELLPAARRELLEETGIHSVEVLDTYPTWLVYDFPPEVKKAVFDGQFDGQKQYWFLMRFTGLESEINLAASHDEPPEFQAWAWLTPPTILARTVAFRRPVYTQLFSYFFHSNQPSA